MQSTKPHWIKFGTRCNGATETSQGNRCRVTNNSVCCRRKIRGRVRRDLVVRIGSLASVREVSMESSYRAEFDPRIIVTAASVVGCSPAHAGCAAQLP